MTATTNPTYANPTIQEAICEIVFSLSGDQTDPLAFSQFYVSVQENYPILEPTPSSGLTVQLIPGEAKDVPPPPAHQALRLRHPTRPYLILFSGDRIAVNVVGNYPGWLAFKSEITEVCVKLASILKPDGILRIGLRYINRIERTSPSETPMEWLEPNKYLPSAVLNSCPGFLSIVMVRTSPYDRTNVTLGEREGEPGSFGAFILDIDRAIERVSSAESPVIEIQLERLHSDIWDVFVSAKGERLEKLLKGEL